MRDMLRGNLIHFPRNFLVALSGMKITDQVTIASYYGQAIVSQTLAYPFLTVQRRKEILTDSQMLRGRGITGTNEYPTTFIGIFRKILAEEGLRTLYRGYMAYMLAIVFWMSALPAGTDFVMNVGPYLSDRIQNRGKLRQAQLER